MRLDLEADVVLVVEPDHAGVVGEDAHQPVEVQVAGGLEDRLLEQVVDDLALELDPARAGSCASSARSRSGPASRARSRSGRGRALRSGRWMAFISARLRESWPDLLRCSERRVVHGRGSAPRRGGTGRAVPGRGDRTASGRRRPARRRRWPARAGSGGAGRRPAPRRGRSGSSGRSSAAKPRSRRIARALCALGVGDARLGQDVDDVPPARSARSGRGPDREGLDHRVDQHRLGGAAGRRATGALDEEPPAGRDPPGAGQPRSAASAAIRALEVGPARGGSICRCHSMIDKDSPAFLDSIRRPTGTSDFDPCQIDESESNA